VKRELVWTTHAVRDLEHLEKADLNRIVAALEAYAETGSGQIKKLAGTSAEWRLRVGDWRVRFSFRSPPPGILILAIEPRDRAYR
jgi:mRNA interferase RelE/StbE